ncbi:calcium-activated potassium channel [Stylonychia lemnae]|uniref:Calcium-activated potassium channel n=1 Tax=Stylonychia lemnae TaxID=5949 RepID=A0A078A4R3_STYLE|nr:calcium-activated potassium channel [Stylonychia lemnae]|eukprot:CDW77260.1 calcium-activated potassium channel [Stylonychia lemnae]
MQSRANAARNSELQNIDYNFQENVKEFNQLKEILRQYNPNKQIARANTIKRRKNKKKLMDKVKTSMMSKLNINHIAQLRKGKMAQSQHEKIQSSTTDIIGGSGGLSTSQVLSRSKKFKNSYPVDKQLTINQLKITDQERKNSDVTSVQNSADPEKVKSSDENESIASRRPKHHSTDQSINNPVIFKEMKSAVDKAKFEQKQSQIIEDEEEYLYFMYNSDSELNFEEYKSNLFQLFGLSKASTVKRLKTSNLDGNGSVLQGHTNRENTEHDPANMSTNSNNRQLSQISKPYEQLVNPASFQSLNQLLIKNPNITFKLETNRSQSQSPNHVAHKSTFESQKSTEQKTSSFGRYLTVDTKFLGLSKSKSPSKDSPGDPSYSSLVGKRPFDKEPHSASKVVVIRPLSSSNQRQETMQPMQSQSMLDELQDRFQIQKNQNIATIEEEYSDNSSPALNKNRFNFKNSQKIHHHRQESNQQTSVDNSQNDSRASARLCSDKDDDKEIDEKPKQEEVQFRKYTSFLTLNKYNKIYTQEFKEEDIEIMNINSILTSQNNKLQRIAKFQLILVIFGFFLFILDSEIYYSNVTEYEFVLLSEDKLNHLISIYLIQPRTHKHLIFIQSFIGVLMQFKFFTLIRFMAYKSPLNSSKGRFITALRGIDYSTAFLIKVWLTMNPVKGLVFGIIFFLFINSFVLYLNERSASIDYIPCYEEDHLYAVSQYRDSVWLTVVTFLTVGYGDFYPTTNLGRYMMIFTAIGGQLSSAIVIGLIHGQLMLTSEESGKGKIKKIHKCITDLLYAQNGWLQKQITVNLTLEFKAELYIRQKGNIHWHKARQVQNIKFEIYVNVMKFKKIKLELANYYSTRGDDSNVSIIKSTETQLALLASEVIKIFGLMKDSKLERKKNINESYFRGRSILNKIIEQESLLKQNAKMMPARVFSENSLAVIDSPTHNQVTKTKSPLELTTFATGKIKQSKTMHQGPSLQKDFSSKVWNQKMDVSIVEELESSSSYDRQKSPRKLQSLVSTTNFQGSFMDTGGLLNQLEERKKQEKLQHQLTILTNSNAANYTNASKKKSYNPKTLWKNITSTESLRILSSEEIDNLSSSKKHVSHQYPRNENFFNFTNQLMVHNTSPMMGSISASPISNTQKRTLDEDFKEEQVNTSPKKLEGNELKLTDNSLENDKEDAMLREKIMLKNSKQKKSLNIEDNGDRYGNVQSKIGVKKDQKLRYEYIWISKKEAKYTKRTNKFQDQCYQKEFIAFAQKQYLDYTNKSNKLKQQKTQLHPNLVSIIEEEETFTEDDEEELQINDELEDSEEDDDDRMDEIQEENSYYEGEESDEQEQESISNDSEKSSRKVQPKISDEKIKISINGQSISENYVYKPKLQNDSQRKRSSTLNPSLSDVNKLNPQPDTEMRKTPSSISSMKSSLSQVFNEYQQKQDLTQSLHILNKIYENYNINSKLKNLKDLNLNKKNYSIEELVSDDLFIPDKQNYEDASKHSISNSGKNKNRKTLIPSDSFYVSEDQYTNSQKSSKSPKKSQVQHKQPDNKASFSQHLTVQLNNDQRTKVNGSKMINQNQQKSQINLQPVQSEKEIQQSQISPFLPYKKKNNEQETQLQLQKSSKSNNETISNNRFSEMQIRQLQTLKLDKHQSNNYQPQIDLLEIIEKHSSVSPTLSLNQKQSILSFQDQINQMLQYNNFNLIGGSQSNIPIKDGSSQSNISPKDSSLSEKLRYLQSPHKMSKKFDAQKEILREELKQEQSRFDSLVDRFDSTSKLVSQTLQEAKLKIQKLKNSQQVPTLQVNIQQLKVSQQSQNTQNTIQMYNMMENVQIHNTNHTHIYSQQPHQSQANSQQQQPQFTYQSNSQQQ